MRHSLRNPPGERREEHSMDQCRSRPKLSENFERHWSIPISGEIHMYQSLVHTFSWGNSYGPMILKVLQQFPPTLALVHGWLFPGQGRKKYTPPPWRPSFFSFSGSEALWCIPFFSDLWCIPFSLVFLGKWYTP